MKIKLDENVTVGLALFLKKSGHDVHTAYEEGLTGKSDIDIWSATQAEARFLITQDLDFSDIRILVPGTHYGILLLRLQSPDQEVIVSRVAEIMATENLDKWHGCLVVATDSKVRVVRP